MTIMVDLHAKTDVDGFKPEIRNLGIHSESPTFHLAFDEQRRFGVFLSHDQMLDLRDALTQGIAGSTVKCYRAECEEAAIATCENADCGNARFCDEHGHKRGAAVDDQANGDGPYVAKAVVSICDACVERSRA